MADKSVDLGGSNLFAANAAYFFPQSSSSPHERDMANMLSASGDIQCETGVNNRSSYTNTYAYCNSTPAIHTDLATLLSTFGAVADSKLVTALTINFTAGQYATVDITGHNHDDNEHTASVAGVANVTSIVPAGSGFGVPAAAFGVVLGTNSTPISATLAFSLNHIDELDSTGEHWVGKNTTVRAELSLELLGIPTSTTVAALEAGMTGWTVDSNGGTDGNQELDHFVITAHQNVDLT